MSECIACTYSGVDEQMYAAHGCPACTCITPEERSMLDYFHNDKGDLKRWAGWEKFAKKRPDVKEAHDKYIRKITKAEKRFKDKYIRKITKAEKRFKELLESL